MRISSSQRRAIRRAERRQAREAITLVPSLIHPLRYHPAKRQANYSRSRQFAQSKRMDECDTSVTLSSISLALSRPLQFVHSEAQSPAALLANSTARFNDFARPIGIACGRRNAYHPVPSSKAGIRSFIRSIIHSAKAGVKVCPVYLWV